LKEAYALRVLARKSEANLQAQQKPDDQNSKTLEEVITAYLDHSRAADRPSTYERRADFLFDFCYGFPGRFRARAGKRTPKPTVNDRIHDSCGRLTVAELLPFHTQQWVDLHPTWALSGSKRFALQALKRALNWAHEVGLGTVKPLYRVKVSRGRSRISYFTPEVEQAMYEHSQSAFRLALKVCIRTGARYGAEFANLQARHVHETEFGQVWRFPPGGNEEQEATGNPGRPRGRRGRQEARRRKRPRSRFPQQPGQALDGAGATLLFRPPEEATRYFYCATLSWPPAAQLAARIMSHSRSSQIAAQRRRHGGTLSSQFESVVANCGVVGQRPRTVTERVSGVRLKRPLGDGLRSDNRRR
jgi:hypothetical protein